MKDQHRMRAAQALIGIVSTSAGVAVWIHWSAGLTAFGVLMLGTSGIWRPVR